MSASAIVMLIFACAVLYGGLFVTIRNAIRSTNEKEKGQ
ncbi:MAG: putative methionine and alanine importer, small subunit [Halanaerobiales bacterium]|nr:putative methionine and alanine importer, small subunit [Halanaerobiales bacterium]